MKKTLLFIMFLMVFLTFGCGATFEIERSYPSRTIYYSPHTIYYTPSGMRFYTDGNYYFDYYGNRLYWNSYQIYEYMEYNKRWNNNIHRINVPKREYNRKDDSVSPRNDDRKRDNPKTERIRENSGERGNDKSEKNDRRK